jgi:hypothetical protein
MKRLVFVTLLLLALAARPAGAATKTYSTGSIALAIPAGNTVERTLSVTDAGPVWFVNVSLRIAHPRASELSITLVGPSGTGVPVSVHGGGSGADYGTGAGCGGELASFQDEQAEPVSLASAPFVDGPYRPEEAFATEYLLGRSDEGLSRVKTAVARADAGRGKMLYGWPAGEAYLKALLAFLKKTGYTS